MRTPKMRQRDTQECVRHRKAGGFHAAKPRIWRARKPIAPASSGTEQFIQWWLMASDHAELNAAQNGAGAVANTELG